MQTQHAVDGPEATHPRVSVLVPVYNEIEVLPEFHRRLTEVLRGSVDSFEVLYVNDGSSDGSLAWLEALCARDPDAALVDLSRNFGKEIAMAAGLDHVRGEAVIVIDADLQDPPELIPRLLEQWRAGYDNVYARRRQRDGETWLNLAKVYNNQGNKAEQRKAAQQALAKGVKNKADAERLANPK